MNEGDFFHICCCPLPLRWYIYAGGGGVLLILVNLIVEHIICPKCCKSQILEDLNEIYIIGPTNAL